MVTEMRYRVLGGTGMTVSAYCLGAMSFGSWGNPDHDSCSQIINEAIDSGINFIDTADVYSQGESEEIVGRALRSRRDEVVLATKAHKQMGEGLNRSGNSRRWIMKAVDDSLRRLGTDWIDLYQMHRPDPTTDIEETLSALTDLVAQGKIRNFGSSTYPAELIVEAHWVADRRGLGRFRCEAPPYSLLVRGIERSVLPTCQRYGMGVVVWFPLAAGWLEGAGNPGQADLSARGDHEKAGRVSQIRGVADELGVTLAHLSMAFTLAHPAITSSIVEVHTVDELHETLRGAALELDDAVLDKLDEIVEPGRDVVAADAGWQPPALADVAARRRPVGQRGAA